MCSSSAVYPPITGVFVKRRVLVKRRALVKRGVFVKRDLISGHQLKALFEPGITGPEVEHLEHTVPEPLHMRRAGCEANRCTDTGPPGYVVARRTTGKREPTDCPTEPSSLLPRM